METFEDKLINRANDIQDEMNKFIEDLLKRKPTLNYDAAKDTFYMLKIAYLELQLESEQKYLNNIVDLNKLK